MYRELNRRWLFCLFQQEKEIQQLKEKLVEKEKLIENAERENVMLKQENGYLKEINELLKGNKQKK